MFVVYLIPYMLAGVEKMYCGHTNDANRRWTEHNKKGYLGTKKKREMRVISKHRTKSLAYREELRVKDLGPEEKIKLYNESEVIIDCLAGQRD